MPVAVEAFGGTSFCPDNARSSVYTAALELVKNRKTNTGKTSKILTRKFVDLFMVIGISKTSTESYVD
jgi:hypothetical protein